MATGLSKTTVFGLFGITLFIALHLLFSQLLLAQAVDQRVNTTAQLIARNESDDLYGGSRGGSEPVPDLPTPSVQNTDAYGVTRGENSALPEEPVSAEQNKNSYDRKTDLEEPPATKPAVPIDKSLDLYSREARAKKVLLVIHRPSSIQGLTGLMVTNSAFSLPAGNAAVGGSVMVEDSDKPNYRIIQMPGTFTYGISNVLELGVKANIIDADVHMAKSRTNGTGLGDTELSLKRRLDTHSAAFPEFAIGLGAILPTGSSSKGLNEVTKWGLKIMTMATSETRVGENSFLGLYVEVQAVLADLFEKKSASSFGADKYGVINAGVLLPISSDHRLQGIVEYNQVLFKRTSFLESDGRAISPSLRYVTEKLSFTAGAQILSKNAKGYADTVRWIGTFGYMF